MKYLSKLYEPFNSISHGLGSLLALAGLVSLLHLAATPLEYVVGGLFGFSLVFMYTSSTLYHAIDSPVGLKELYRKLDYSSIYLLIAGTGTPIALLGLGVQNGGLSLFVFLWLFAVVGVILTLKRPFESRWAPTLLYLAMGWLPILYLEALLETLSVGGLTWCATGGVMYTIGALCYMTDWPRIYPDWFGAHGLWHLFIILGSGSHYVLVTVYIF